VYWNTKVFTWMNAIVVAFLTALGARPAAALLLTPTCVLFTDGPAPGSSTDIADYTVGGSSGYADVALTLSSVLNFPNGARGLIANALFTGDSTSPFVGATYIGYLITDGTTAIYGGELFDDPLPISASGDWIEVDVVLPLNAIQPCV